jgi:hypothetical protein
VSISQGENTPSPFQETSVHTRETLLLQHLSIKYLCPWAIKKAIKPNFHDKSHLFSKARIGIRIPLLIALFSIVLDILDTLRRQKHKNREGRNNIIIYR